MLIVVKCEDMIVARVLIDNGLALNVCPIATLERLKVDMSLIRPNYTLPPFTISSILLRDTIATNLFYKWLR